MRANQRRTLPEFPNLELLLVSGYSGIGKSALVQEIYKPITQQRGYFIAGKFDQLQRNIPYSAITQAFKSLVRQLLSESAARLAQWRSKILAAVGNNGQMMIDVIPDLEMIIGAQPVGQPLELFVNEFLKALDRDNLLIFDYQQGCWQWDMKTIEQRDIADNVVNLTIDNLKKLPEST